MSEQRPSLDSLCEDAIYDAAEKGWDDLLDKADQPINPFAEDLWEMEKKKARQQQERNTRHSVDKGEEFIKSGMTLITDVESDKYLKRLDKQQRIEYTIFIVHLMLALLLAFTLAHHDDANPYGWHMSCERFLQRSTEIRIDPNLDLRSKLNLIAYLKSKVEGECKGVYT